MNSRIIKDKVKYFCAVLMPKKIYMKWMFKKNVGYSLDLVTPKTLNEKIQWLKLNYQTELLTKCADKFKVRDYIKETIGEDYLIPLMGVFHDVDHINIDSLPDEPFIIKANHTSGTFKIVRSKIGLDVDALKKECRSWIKENYYTLSKEWQYKDIEPCIIVEKLLLDKSDNIPSDIKFSCINGVVEIIHIDSNKEVVHLRNNYSKNWQHLPFQWPNEYKENVPIEKPLLLDRLVELAEELSKPFPFARIDFYAVEGEIYFGEITFHPTSGYGNFSEFKYDRIYGDMLKLNNVSGGKVE